MGFVVQERLEEEKEDSWPWVSQLLEWSQNCMLDTGYWEK